MVYFVDEVFRRFGNWAGRHLFPKSVRFLEWLVSSGWHAYLFLISTWIYWVFYDKMVHSYLSTMYAEDKYGVVINYAFIVLIDFVDDLTKRLIVLSEAQEQERKDKQTEKPREDTQINKSATTTSDGTKLRKSRAKDSLATKEPEQCENPNPIVAREGTGKGLSMGSNSLRFARIAAFMAFLKIILFNFIFSKNTDAYDMDKVWVHRFCMFLLTVIAWVSVIFASSNKDDDRKAFFTFKLKKWLFLIVFFKVCGNISELEYVNQTFWNFWALTLETLLIMETII